MTDLRTLERDSIRAFVQKAADEGYLSGRVLDWGCGKQPYREIVEAAGGEYVGYDRSVFPANVGGEDSGPAEPLYPFHEWDAILCTQVVQYLPIARNSGYRDNWPLVVWEWSASLARGGCLVLTWPICWPLVEEEDLHRFTVSGMKRLLSEAGFEIVRCEVRATYNDFPIGGQAVARA